MEPAPCTVEEIIARKCGGTWRRVIRLAAAVIPHNSMRTSGDGGSLTEWGIVRFTGYIDHKHMYLAGGFCLYNIVAGGQPSNTKLGSNKLRGTP